MFRNACRLAGNRSRCHTYVLRPGRQMRRIWLRGPTSSLTPTPMHTIYRSTGRLISYWGMTLHFSKVIGGWSCRNWKWSWKPWKRNHHWRNGRSFAWSLQPQANGPRDRDTKPHPDVFLPPIILSGEFLRSLALSSLSNVTDNFYNSSITTEVLLTLSIYFSHLPSSFIQNLIGISRSTR